MLSRGQAGPFYTPPEGGPTRGSAFSSSHGGVSAAQPGLLESSGRCAPLLSLFTRPGLPRSLPRGSLCLPLPHLAPPSRVCGRRAVGGAGTSEQLFKVA